MSRKLDLKTIRRRVQRPLQSSVQIPILNRFGDVGLDFFGAGEVGDGAARFGDPAVGAGAYAQLVDRGFEKFLRVMLHGTVTLLLFFFVVKRGKGTILIPGFY